MKNRTLIGAIVVVVIVATIFFCQWNMAGGNAPTAATVAPVASALPNPPAPSATSATKTPPDSLATSHSATTATASQPASLPNTLELDLKAASADGLRMLQNQDLGLFTRTYLRAPKPGVVVVKISSDDNFTREMMNSPNGPHTLQRTIAFFQAMQSMTPTLNEAGDQAIYKDVPTLSGGKTDLTWIMDSGHWYLKGDWPMAE